MSRFLVTTSLLLLCLLNHGTGTGIAPAWDDQDFFSVCPRTRCSKDGPEIRFPLRLESSNSSPSCGSAAAACTKLACSGEDTILRHPFLGPSKVVELDYGHSLMKIVPLVEQQFSECPMIQQPRLPAQVDDSCFLYRYEPGRLVGCSREFTLSGAVQYGGSCDTNYDPCSTNAADFISGPIPCHSNPGNFTYLVHACLLTSLLPLDCKALSNRLVPISLMVPEGTQTFKQRAEIFNDFSEIITSWDQQIWNLTSKSWSSITKFCRDCESRGQPCAFSSQRNKPFCMPQKGLRHTVIAATSSVAGFIVLSLILATVLYISLKSKYNEEIHLKVEMFLRTYGTSKPTRYSFSEVKKIARRFKEKLGQGGFGTVYRGQLPNGVPVAVKMLENSTGEGEDFINEVATIGSIHHTNIVRLLGFCSEGTRRALIYEFMPNESLEKHIFPCDYNAYQRLLVPNKMLVIALGIARGMEYLHQGCNQRILHLDIKPHNILLNYNFNPKISDFGLANQCARDQSIITLLAARGTMGYVAPEIYSRNFGGISYKSDVYSFGMLVLEMVSGKRNSDPGIENQNEVYFLEWIHEKVSTGQDLVPNRETTEEKQMLRQLAIVALWCIQWNPKDRPSMTKVVNMLTGRLQNLQIPPKPFVSSGSYLMP
ncbi:unnamed protein product [Urochloa decumbens]|uniref:non-specific serine/threonine protein kinase n=1 Tax=Urochloa decumbens TaxID=240449 RepID=A0ABC8YZT4_9POAL